MAFYGIDLHTDRFTVAKVVVKEDKLETISMSYQLTDDKSFSEFKAGLRENDYVAIEASGNSFWFHDQIVGLIKKCYIYNPAKENNNGNKTDKIDARKLANKLAFFVCMGGEKRDFPTVYVPDEKVRELRCLFTSYSLQNKMKVQVKNRIHSLLKEVGICVKKSELNRVGFRMQLEEYDLSIIRKNQIILLLQELKSINDYQKNIEEMIALLGDELFANEIEILLSIKGFSVFTAICLMTDVADINRFSNAKKFCSYLRTAPKVKSSNKTTHIGKVNKCSRATTCTLLTQSIIHFRKEEGYLKEFYDRVRIGKSAGKSRMALVRKILVSAYNMLKKKEMYYWVDEILYESKIKAYRKEIKKIQEKYCNISRKKLA